MIRRMSWRSRAVRSQFLSALIGGAVVGIFFWVAIAAGWVDSQESPSAEPAQTALTAPVVNRESDANVVNQIYKRDGQGVAFIEADQPAPEASPFDPFAEPEGGT